LPLRRLVESAVKSSPDLLSGHIPIAKTAGILDVEIAKTVSPAFELHSGKSTQLLLLVNVPFATTTPSDGLSTIATQEMSPEVTAVTDAMSP